MLLMYTEFEPKLVRQHYIYIPYFLDYKAHLNISRTS